MTREESTGAFYYDFSNYHDCAASQKDGIVTASFYSRYQPTLFPDRACPLLDSGIDSLRHHDGRGDFANCECGRIHKALPIVDLVARWRLGGVRGINQRMFRRVTVCLAIVAALFSATIRLPAAPCIVT